MIRFPLCLNETNFLVVPMLSQRQYLKNIINAIRYSVFFCEKNELFFLCSLNIYVCLLKIKPIFSEMSFGPEFLISNLAMKTPPPTKIYI